jgi:hypothetical protein
MEMLYLMLFFIALLAVSFYSSAHYKLYYKVNTASKLVQIGDRQYYNYIDNENILGRFLK